MPTSRLATAGSCHCLYEWSSSSKLLSSFQKALNQLRVSYSVALEISRVDQPLRSVQEEWGAASSLPQHLGDPDCSWRSLPRRASQQGPCISLESFSRDFRTALSQSGQGFSRPAQAALQKDLRCSSSTWNNNSIRASPPASNSMTQVSGFATDSRAGSETPVSSSAPAAEQPESSSSPAPGGDEGSGSRQSSRGGENADEAAVEAACERMVLEVVRLLQEGKLDQAEYLLLEGVKYVEASLPDSAGLASLLDQQALVQFLAGKLLEAEAAAARMLALAQRLFADEEAAVAMCSLRLGTALAGQGRWEEAEPLLLEAAEALRGAFGEEYEALGEARFYLALGKVAGSTEASLPAVDIELIEALMRMRANVGVGPLLAGAALREHHRILEDALQLEDWSRAEALFLQEIRLHEALDPGSEGLALLLYQFSTLQFILGRTDDARTLCQRSSALTEKAHRPGSDQAMLRTHRLGTIAAAAQETDTAERLLSQSQQHFSKRLGQDNPITGEARFYLALTRLHVLESKAVGMDPFDRVMTPSRRGDLLAELAGGCEAMARGFGAEHMLVRKARELERQRVA